MWDMERVSDLAVRWQTGVSGSPGLQRGGAPPMLCTLWDGRHGPVLHGDCAAGWIRPCCVRVS